MAATAIITPDGVQSLITAGEAAALCGVDAKTIYSWCDRGKLSAAGLDTKKRKLFRLIDVAKAERATRDHPAGRSRR